MKNSLDIGYTSEQTFANEDYTNSTLAPGEYDGCVFKSCNFSSAELMDIRFIDSEFMDCDFSNAHLTDTSIQNVVFRDCKLQGLNFTECNAFAFFAQFINCVLSYSVFSQMKLQGTAMERTVLHAVDFSGADLKKAKLCQCDFQDAMFDNTNLEGADLRQSINIVMDPERNRLKGARFSLTSVVGLLQKYGVKVDC